MSRQLLRSQNAADGARLGLHEHKRTYMGRLCYAAGCSTTQISSSLTPVDRPWGCLIAGEGRACNSRVQRHPSAPCMEEKAHRTREAMSCAAQREQPSLELPPFHLFSPYKARTGGLSVLRFLRWTSRGRGHITSLLSHVISQSCFGSFFLLLQHCLCIQVACNTTTVHCS